MQQKGEGEVNSLFSLLELGSPSFPTLGHRSFWFLELWTP